MKQFRLWELSQPVFCFMYAVIDVTDKYGGWYLHDRCWCVSTLTHQWQAARRTLTGSGTWYSIYNSKVRWARCYSENSALSSAPYKWIPQNIVRSLFGLSSCKTERPGQKITAFGFCTLFTIWQGKIVYFGPRTMFCPRPFAMPILGAMKQRAHSIVLPSVFLKD